MFVAHLRFALAAFLTFFWSSLTLLLCPFGPRRAWLITRTRWGKTVMAALGIDWEIQNAERLRNPAVFVSNHQSFLDIVLLPAILPPEAVFVAKREIRRVPVFGIAFATSGGVMIDRRNPRGAIASIREAVATLPKDWSVVIFPEGTRSKTGELKAFKKGCIHVALATRYPIVPMAVHGVRELTSTPGWWPRWLPSPGRQRASTSNSLRFKQRSEWSFRGLALLGRGRPKRIDLYPPTSWKLRAAPSRVSLC